MLARTDESLRQQVVKLAQLQHALSIREERLRQENPDGGLIAFVRYFWPVLEPVDPFVEGWALEAMCAHLEAVSRGEIIDLGGEERQLNRLLVNVPPGFMKLVADATPILTPDGYRTHGDLKPGDSVFGPDGKPTKVVRISPKAPADYEVTFSTHETIKCNGDHLWHVYDRWAKKYKTIDTRELHGAATEPGRSRFFIPDTRCLEFPERELPLHPYFLGCWLGDGGAVKPAISHSVHDTEHIAKLDALGYRVTTQHPQKNTLHSYFARQGIVEMLRAMGLFGNKHIPDAYLTASEGQRLELLAGLIDTDGSVDKERGRCTFYTCDPALAEGVQKLVLSLGMRPYVTLWDAPGYEEYSSDKTYYHVGFQPDRAIPTALPRKQVRRLDFAKRKRSIVSVKKSASPEMGHCITVARPDGLYVVGRTNVVTHNSMLLNVFWPAWEWGPCKRPHLRYVCFSYAAELTERDNAKFRDLICSDRYREMWGHVYRVTSDGQVRVKNNKTGFKFATSIGGVGTGERGHRVILDDPHKIKGTNETDEARSAVTNWVREAMQNRLNSTERDAIIVIMQRVHDADTSGVIIDTLSDEYCHLVIPMEFEYGRHFSHYTGWNGGADPRTEKGELAWPERYPDRVLRSYRRYAYLWSGQYQQNPIPRGGGIFKEEWIQPYETPEDGWYDFEPVFTLASLDTAFKDKEESDYSALVVLTVYNHPKTGQRKVLITDAWHKRLRLNGKFVQRLQNEDEKAFLYRAAPHWGLTEWVDFTCKKRKIDCLVVEDSARGPDLNDELRRLFSSRDWSIILEPAKGDKWSRANAVVSMFTDDMIEMPGEFRCGSHGRRGCNECPAEGHIWWWREWVYDVIKELTAFPRHAHDDYVDAIVQGLRHLRKRGLAMRNEEREFLEEQLKIYKKPSKPLYPGSR